MADLDRRAFLRGAAVCAIAAALPAPVVEVSNDRFALMLWARTVEREALQLNPIFQGAIGIYNGVVIREVEDLHGYPRGQG